MKTPLVVTQFLDRARSIFGSSVGAVCGADRLTYGQLASRVDRLSSSLESLGVRRGDVVACLSFNCHRLLELYYAVPQMGAILLPINVRLTSDDIAYIVNDSGASTLVVERALAGLVAPDRQRLPGVERLILMGPDAAHGSQVHGDDYETLLDDAAEGYARPALDEDDVAELFYTSGTTARPKGVMLTHRSLYLHAMSLLAAVHVTEADVQLHTIPLFHVNGWGTPHTVTFMGGRHVMLAKFDPEQVLETIEAERVTQMLLVPTMAVALLNAPSASKRDLSSLRRIKIGGAASAPSLIAALDAWLPGCTIVSGYGLTETTPVLTIASLRSDVGGDAARSAMIRSSAGLPLPGVEVAILDDAGLALPHDGVAIGEICARGNAVMAGYWKQPDATRQAIVDGWLHTGDVGMIDPNGYVHIVDRKKDIIITGGENVSSLEIEKAICEAPAVLECAVISVPDRVWGEIPAALVVLKQGAELTESALIEHCKGKLAGFKCPKRVKMVASLPKGGTGKILKRELRDLYVTELTRA